MRCRRIVSYRPSTNGHNKILVNIFFSFFQVKEYKKCVPRESSHHHLKRGTRTLSFTSAAFQGKVPGRVCTTFHKRKHAEMGKSSQRGPRFTFSKKILGPFLSIHEARLAARFYANIYPAASTCALKNEILRYPSSSF